MEQPAAEAVLERAEAAEGEHGHEEGSSGRGLIEGLTHRILAYLYRERRRGGLRSDELRRFYYYFEKYARLAIWKARTRGEAAPVTRGEFQVQVKSCLAWFCRFLICKPFGSPCPVSVCT